MKYCEFCGKVIEGKGPCSCPEAQEQAKTKQGILNKKILIIGLCAVVVLTVVIVAAFALFSGSEGGNSLFESSKINPFDYLEITFEGYDGIGTAYISFDENGVDEEIFGPEPDSMQEYFEWESRYEAFEGSIEYECSQEEGLSNGDEITVTFTVTGDYKKHVREKSKEITVKGLTEAEKFDFFANIELVFEGFSGAADVEVNRLVESEVMDACRFSCSPRWTLATGDIVTVTINNPETLARVYNTVPLELSKGYTVPKLPEYVSTAEQISVTIIKEFANKFIEETKEENVESMKDMAGIGVKWTYSQPQFHSAYFMKRTSYHSWVKNELLIVVSYIKNEGTSDEETVCTLLEFYNVGISTDGSFNIKYEDGSNSVFTTNWNKTFDDYKEDYDIYEIAVN